MNQLWLTVRLVRSFALAAAFVCVAMASTVFAQNADLSISKSGPATIVANTDVEYLVRVDNFSGESSTPTNTLTDTFPAELTYVSVVPPDGWTCTAPPVAGPNTITCTSENAITSGDESAQVFSFTFHVGSDLPVGTQVTNSASISHQGTDGNSDNNSTSFTSVVNTPPPPPLVAREVLISEFRLSGPGGSEDDFIELYCNRDTDCDISNMSLRGYDPVRVGDLSMTFPPQTIIPARQYLLVGDSRGYTLFSYGSPDFDVADFQPTPTMEDPSPSPFYFYDNEGLQLIGAEEPTIIDSVGFAGGGNAAQYIEGTGLERASARPLDQYAYVRKRTMVTNGLPQDTNNNANDFVLVSVTGNSHTGITAPPVLGAPGPQGLSSPKTFTNSEVNGVLVDQTKSKEESPNRVRVGTGDSGTLSIRRSFTNNTSFTFNYLSFRVIEINTLNSPAIFGDQTAQLRLVSSGSTSADVPSRGGTVFINGTTLEYDPMCECLQPQQPNGGGLNSTVFVASEEFTMGPGDTIDVQFLLNVVKAGLYRYYVYVEAGFSRGEVIGAPSLGNVPSRLPAKPSEPRKFAGARFVPTASGIKNSKPVTPAIRPATTTAPPARLTTPVTNAPISAPVRNALTPRVIIINRGIAEGEKKPRKKLRVRRKNSAALKKKAEERFAAEKPEN